MHPLRPRIFSLVFHHRLAGVSQLLQNDRDREQQMKPSKKHFIVYDAQTYEEKGFIEVKGRVRQLAERPRYWQVTATVKTQDPATGEQAKAHFKFIPQQRFKLSELAPIVNEEIHTHEDYLPDCISVMVVARVML